MSQVLVGKEQALSSQFNILLGVVNHLTSALSSSETMTGVPGTPLDGGAKSALESTIIRACNRLDALLEEKKNWGAPEQNRVIKQICKTHRAQQIFLKAQTASANEVRRPSFQLRPNLIRVETGFAAIHGDPSKPNEYILGVGETPEAALLDFDEAFKRKPSQQSTLIQPNAKKKSK